MKLIDKIYRTKSLRNHGIFILIALVVILVVGKLFIPDYPVQHVDEQILKLKGKHFRFDDSPHVSEFIQSVKSRNGFICMGTSESTTLRDGNYYEFLDQDTSYQTRFSILSGAGRSCGMHMPMLLRHQQEVDSLRLIYFINPVYWRSELNHFDKGYWTRYVNYKAYNNALLKDQQGLLADVSNQYSTELNFGEKFLHYSEYQIRKLRKPFFHDLRYWLNPLSYLNDLEYLAKAKEGCEQFDYFGYIDTSYLDTSWNITHEFKNRTWLNPMVEDEYRSIELKNFIKLCNDLGVEVTFVLGPVNEIFIERYKPSYLEGYQNTVQKIRQILQEEHVDWIDVTFLGTVPGSFIDNQHHSSYGAYLIYKEIKKHLHEKGDL